jgi:nitrogen fixation protein FixH
MNPTALPTARRQQGLNGHHVLCILLTFFGAVFLINGAMIYWALSTHTGLVANEPYRSGLNYNQRIVAGERQARLGWIDKLEVQRDGRVVLAVVDRNDHPVIGLVIHAVLGRPSTDHHDIKIALSEGTPGHYQAQTVPLGAGNWVFSAEARTAASGGRAVYRVRRRLWLKP